MTARARAEQAVFAGKAGWQTKARWLESQASDEWQRLAKIGLLDRKRLVSAKPFSEHVDNFKQVLLDKGNTARHAALVAGRARRVVKGCGFASWSEVSGSKVMAYLSDLRDNGNSISAQTFNFYLQAVKQFGKWMVRDGRTASLSWRPAWRKRWQEEGWPWPRMATMDP